MNDENLNIDKHTVSLLLKALNRNDHLKGAAKDLGISLKTLYTKMKQYNISLEWIVKPQ